MKVEEKLTNKEKRAVIIRKYQQYLKLEKALSPNTLDDGPTETSALSGRREYRNSGRNTG
jgi:integrase/recombinase XerD